jgi:hypothetical protein
MVPDAKLSIQAQMVVKLCTAYISQIKLSQRSYGFKSTRRSTTSKLHFRRNVLVLSCWMREREGEGEVHGGVVSPVSASSEDREGSKGGLVTFICGL